MTGSVGGGTPYAEAVLEVNYGEKKPLLTAQTSDPSHNFYGRFSLIFGVLWRRFRQRCVSRDYLAAVTWGKRINLTAAKLLRNEARSGH